MTERAWKVTAPYIIYTHFPSPLLDTQDPRARRLDDPVDDAVLQGLGRVKVLVAVEVVLDLRRSPSRQAGQPSPAVLAHPGKQRVGHVRASDEHQVRILVPGSTRVS